MNAFFQKQARPREATPPEPPDDSPRLRVVGIPPGESAAHLANEFAGVRVERQPEIPPAADVPTIEPAAEFQDGIGRGLTAIRDGAPGMIAVSYLEGTTWKHVIRTNDFPHREHNVALKQWAALLKRQRQAAEREAS